MAKEVTWVILSGKHVEIDKKSPLQQQHYDRWLLLWTATVDELFAGEVANEAKKKATTMLQLISMKVTMARDKQIDIVITQG